MQVVIYSEREENQKGAREWLMGSGRKPTLQKGGLRKEHLNTVYTTEKKLSEELLSSQSLQKEWQMLRPGSESVLAQGDGFANEVMG